MPDQPTQEPASSEATQEQKKYAASDPSAVSDPNRLYKIIRISVEEAHQMDIPIASATMLGIVISAIIKRIEALESRPTGTMARKEERETFLEERETYLPGFTVPPSNHEEAMKFATECKHNAEDKILQAITEFEQLTGMKVDGIDFDRQLLFPNTSTPGPAVISIRAMLR